MSLDDLMRAREAVEWVGGGSGRSLTVEYYRHILLAIGLDPDGDPYTEAELRAALDAAIRREVLESSEHARAFLVE